MKKKIVAGVIAAVGMLGLVGCNSSTSETTSTTEQTSSTEEQTASETATSSQNDTVTEASKNTEETRENSNIFKLLSEQEFDFSSGAGAWGTVLNIDENGEFIGSYHDADAGDIEDDYPNGTIYYCNFDGKFSDLKKVDDYTYSMKLAEINTEKEEGTEEIIDGIRYVYSIPYGLDSADEIQVYTPGKSVESLPNGYKLWAEIEEGTDKISFYGIYNVNAEEGFVGYRKSVDSVQDCCQN